MSKNATFGVDILPRDDLGFAEYLDGDTPDKEILSSPDVLRAALDTLIKRYGNNKTRKTTPVKIDIPHLKLYDYEVFAGSGQEEWFDLSLYMLDKQNKPLELLVFRGFGEEIAIIDGDGNAVESLEERKILREIIDKMKSKYAEISAGAVDVIDVREVVVCDIENRIRAITIELVKLEGLMNGLGNRYTFCISIGNRHAPDNGKGPINQIIEAGSPSEAISLAIDKLNNQNGYRNPNLNVSVSVLLGEILLPLQIENIEQFVASLMVVDSEEGAIKEIVRFNK